MKINVTEQMFHQAFVDYNRPNNFTHEGVGLLYEYLIELEEDTNIELELDPIGICCEYSEWILSGVVKNYSDLENIEIKDGIVTDEQREEILEYLHKNTLVVGQPTQDSVLFADF